MFQSDHNPTVGLPSKYAASDMSQLKLPAEKETARPKAFIRTLANKARNAARKRKR